MGKRPKANSPYEARARKNGSVLAKVYAPCDGRDSYRVAWRAAGKRMMKSFQAFAGPGGAREFADKLVREMAKGSQAPLVTPKEAQDALSIREILNRYREETGRAISAVEAVESCITASKLLPANASLIEAVRVYARTLSTVKPKSIAEAVKEFVESRKSTPKPGARGRFSPVYARNVESWLTRFSEIFAGHQVSDLASELFEVYFSKFKDLSEKARNDRRAAVGMWLRWCGRKEYIEATQLEKLLICDSMCREIVQAGKIEFYTPGELRKILVASEGALRAVTALEAFGGARLQEALRLRWEDLYRTHGHIEISGLQSKTRKRRLLEVGPALELWLAGFKDRTGPIWEKPLNSFVTEWARLRESVEVPSKRNGVRHGFVSFSYILRGELETSALAGTSPQILHQYYRGLATKAEAQKWFSVKPQKPGNVIDLPSRNVLPYERGK